MAGTATAKTTPTKFEKEKRTGQESKYETSATNGGPKYRLVREKELVKPQ